MEKEFEMPEVEIISLDEDIITTSGCLGGGMGGVNEVEII